MGKGFRLFWDGIDVLEEIALWLTPSRPSQATSHILVVLWPFYPGFAFVSLKAYKVRVAIPAGVQVSCQVRLE